MAALNTIDTRLAKRLQTACALHGVLCLVRVASRRRQRIETQSAHVTPVGGNVFTNLGLDPDETAVLKAETTARIRDA